MNLSHISDLQTININVLNNSGQLTVGDCIIKDCSIISTVFKV